MTILLVVVALVVITGIAVFAVGDRGRMRDDAPDREPADLPTDREVEAADIDRVRFAIGVRGYRMDQVDGVLDQVATELGARSAREAQLVAQIRGLGHVPALSVPDDVIESGADEPSVADGPEPAVADLAAAPEDGAHG